MTTNPSENTNQAIPFKAETKELLQILIHSLYNEREIFLRELISNASDALTRMDFEQLTNRDVLAPETLLAIHISFDKDAKTLTITDSGIGMDAAEMADNLGTIAHSGAHDFMQAAQAGDPRLSDLIGQFGVGFYSAFMVADQIEVVSRSYRPDAQAAKWTSTGIDTFNIEPAERAERGTAITLSMREDALEFLEDYRLREIIRKHSDFISFPIYLGDSQEQVNRQTALWRQPAAQIQEKDAHEFYQQLTHDPEPPLIYGSMSVDAPAQMYALLFIPKGQERGAFPLRREDGLKLYSRKILIQEFCRDLLPEYLRFMQGVVDSEDLPLNVSRETVQSNRVMGQLKKLVTGKTFDLLKKLAAEKPESYVSFWEAYADAIKQGAATDMVDGENTFPLLRFRTAHHPTEWVSLDDYIGQMQPGQTAIYYVMGDNERAIVHSPHLDVLHKGGYDALLMTDPMDSFLLLRLNQYQDHPLQNVAGADFKLPEPATPPAEPEAAQPAESDSTQIVERFKTQLGARVTDVRVTTLLQDAPARLVDPQGAMQPEMQRVYRILNKDYEAPQKVLEINPQHPVLQSLNALDAGDTLSGLVIEQIYEDTLLIEGLHPDPASMVTRIQKILEAALTKAEQAKDIKAE
jgi:molecular chaperone HtpG